jgi:hypothetical protein
MESLRPCDLPVILSINAEDKLRGHTVNELVPSTMPVPIKLTQVLGGQADLDLVPDKTGGGVFNAVSARMNGNVILVMVKTKLLRIILATDVDNDVSSGQSLRIPSPDNGMNLTGVRQQPKSNSNDFVCVEKSIVYSNYFLIHNSFLKLKKVEHLYIPLMYSMQDRIYSIPTSMMYNLKKIELQGGG